MKRDKGLGDERDERDERDLPVKSSTRSSWQPQRHFKSACAASLLSRVTVPHSTMSLLDKPSAVRAQQPLSLAANSAAPSTPNSLAATHEHK